MDARKLGHLIDRKHRDLSDGEISRIACTHHAWRGEEGPGKYKDVSGFCKSAASEEIATHGPILMPGRYVGAEEQEDDGEPLEKKMIRVTAELRGQFESSGALEAVIRENLKRLGHGR